MFKSIKLFIVLFVFCGFSIAADNLYIDYLDGYLEVKSGIDWTFIDIGDDVKQTDFLRLSENAYVELLYGDVKITLDKDGTYELNTLLDQVVKADRWGIKGSSFTRLFQDHQLDKNQTSVMGVRGDPQKEEQITWIDDDFEFLEEGKILYHNREFGSALEVLIEGSEWFGSNYNEILFYKALCEYETGQFRDMRWSLNEMNPESDSGYFGDYVLFKGNILIESQDFKEAEELFDRYLSEAEQRDDEQRIYLLSAFCSLELDNKDFAERKLKKAITIDPLSNTGIKATDILRDL